jgi:O-methyltransferase involved in polyketide biosynthesis
MPLWGRARATLANSRILSDPKAVEISRKLEVDFEKISRVLPASNDLVSIARARVLDELIRRFLSNHPRATIVNLGAGLDTAFWRLDNGLLRWFDVDLPEVIEIRRKLFPETDRSRCVSGSLLEANWVQEMAPRAGGLFLFSSGVFVYFRTTELQKLFSILAGSLPGAELAFDIQSRMSSFFGNFVLRRAGMGSARFRWGARTADSILKLHGGLDLVEEFGVFSRFADDSFSDNTALRAARTMDRVHAMTIVHVKIKESFASEP